MAKLVPVEDINVARLAKKIRDLHKSVVAAELAEQKYRDLVATRRLEMGQLLRNARENWPARGPNAKGWGRFLASCGVDQTVALDAMKYAGFVEEKFPGAVPGKLPTLAEAGIDTRPRKGELLLTAGDAPNRDAYCTPPEVATALPKKLDLDPCSNPNSIVVAKTRYSLETGQNGLELPWFGLVYANVPFSDPLPWAEKLDRERPNVKGAGFMVNADHSPAWWKVLTRHLSLRIDFDERLEFIPPAGVEPSKNDRPQTLLMDPAFWRACDQRALLEIGTLWIKQPKA